MINHIDEGLYILKRIGASEWAQRAYAIHPILQGDDELAAFWSSDQVPHATPLRVEGCSGILLTRFCDSWSRCSRRIRWTGG